MATVLRVKRRRNEEPQEALVLACKRSKTSEENATVPDGFTAIATLAATVKSQAEDISKLISKSNRETKRRYDHVHKVDIHGKARRIRREATQKSRYKIISYFRHFKECENKDSTSSEEKNLIVIDIESPSAQKVEENSKTDDAEHDDSYVYDIYFGERGDECDFASLEHLVDVMPYSNEWDYGRSKESESDDPGDDEDDDDSNDENNWRNDYPDSDNSENEDDVRLAMQLGDMHLDTCRSDLSSEDEDLIYGVDINPLDVDNFGRRYANYKARMLRELSQRSSSFSSLNGEEGPSDEEDPVLRFL